MWLNCIGTSFLKSPLTFIPFLLGRGKSDGLISEKERAVAIKKHISLIIIIGICCVLFAVVFFLFSPHAYAEVKENAKTPSPAIDQKKDDSADAGAKNKKEAQAEEEYIKNLSPSTEGVIFGVNPFTKAIETTPESKSNINTRELKGKLIEKINTAKNENEKKKWQELFMNVDQGIPGAEDKAIDALNLSAQEKPQDTKDTSTTIGQESKIPGEEPAGAPAGYFIEHPTMKNCTDRGSKSLPTWDVDVSSYGKPEWCRNDFQMFTKEEKGHIEGMKEAQRKKEAEMAEEERRTKQKSNYRFTFEDHSSFTEKETISHWYQSCYVDEKLRERSGELKVLIIYRDVFLITISNTDSNTQGNLFQECAPMIEKTRQLIDLRFPEEEKEEKPSV